MTRKVVLFIAMSIDNYIADDQGAVDWLEDNIRGNEVDDSYNQMYSKIDTVVMGRITYDQVTQELSPEKYMYEDRQSYIITSRPEQDTDSIKFRNQSPVELIQELQKEDGKDIWIIGGAQIVDPLVQANLIDEYILTTIPIFMGSGIRLFKEIGAQVPVQLVDVYQKNELVYSIYQRG
jgi:dihydrofolate reductase